MAAPESATNAATDVLERVIETGDMRERIDRGVLDQIPFFWLWTGLLAVVAIYVLWLIVRRIRLRVEKRRDPYALPGRSFERCMTELHKKIRELSGQEILDAEEEGRWLKAYRETERAGPRYTKLVDVFQAEVVEKDIQFFGDLQSRFDEMVAAWKSMVEHAQGLTASMADAEHLINTRRRANDKLQEFLEAAKEFEAQHDRVVHQPQKLRRG